MKTGKRSPRLLIEMSLVPFGGAVQDEGGEGQRQRETVGLHWDMTATDKDSPSPVSRPPMGYDQVGILGGHGSCVGDKVMVASAKGKTGES